MRTIYQNCAEMARIFVPGLRYVLARLMASLVSGAIVLTSIPLTSAPAWADKDKRVALVIGNSKYGNGVAELSNPLNDATDVADGLEALNFTVFRYNDLNEDEFRKALKKFAREASSSSTALFFYAGHAMHFDEESYLMPVGVQVDDETAVRFNMISVEDDVIKRALADVPVKILILDACRDNPIANQYSASLSKSRSIGDVRGLAPIGQASKGMLVAYATSPNQVAEDGKGRNSPFSGALKKHMREPGVEIRSMLKEVESDVRQETGDRQRPEITDSLPGNFFLSPGDSDEIVWSGIKESKDVSQLNDFIKRFPKSSLVGSAMDKIRLLQLEEQVQRLEGEAAKREQDATKAAEDAKAASAKEQSLAEEADRQRKALQAETDRENEIKEAAKKEQRLKQEADRQAAEKAAEAARLEAARQQDVAKQLAIAKAAEEARQKQIAQEAARQEAARQEAQRIVAEKVAAAQAEAKRLEAVRADLARQAKAKADESARLNAIKQDLAAKAEAAKAEAAQREAAAKAEAAQRDAEQKAAAALASKAASEAAAREDLNRRTAEKAAKALADQKEAARLEAAKQEAARQDAVKQEAAKAQAAAAAAQQSVHDTAAELERAQAEKRKNEAQAALEKTLAASRIAKRDAALKVEQAKRAQGVALEVRRAAVKVAIRRRTGDAVAERVRLDVPRAAAQPAAPRAQESQGCMSCGF